jgi:hypothetical protein
MDNSNGLQGFAVMIQAWAVGLSNWFISALPTAILIMSAALTALQLYVFVRDKLRKPKE